MLAPVNAFQAVKDAASTSLRDISVIDESWERLDNGDLSSPSSSCLVFGGGWLGDGGF